MFFEGRAKVVGEIGITNIKLPMLEIDEKIWEQDPRRKVNKNFSDCHSLWLVKHFETRDGFLHSINTLTTCNNPSFETEWASISDQVSSIVKGIIVRSNIIRLPPGCSVHRHVDGHSDVFKYCHRIILPIISNDSPYLYYDDSNYVLEEGILYDSNGYVPHWATNLGDVNTYTAIFDVLPLSETAVKSQFHPNTVDSLKHLSSISIKKTHNNATLENWQVKYNQEKQEKMNNNNCFEKLNVTLSPDHPI